MGTSQGISEFSPISIKYTPFKLNILNPKMEVDGSDVIFLFEGVMFKFYVEFPGSIFEHISVPKKGVAVRNKFSCRCHFMKCGLGGVRIFSMVR